MKHRPGLIGVLCLIAVAPLAALAPTITNHPAVTPYAGSVATSRQDVGHAEYRLVTRVDEKGRTDEEVLPTLAVTGDLVRLAYENPRDRSASEIFQNYREALLAAEFRILFECATTACGPAYASSRWSRVTGLRYVTPQMHYLAAFGKQGEQEIYVGVLVSPLRHQIDIVEVAPLELGLVTAKVIAEGLLRDGRVVLDGILFDTDRATIRAESAAALDNIARYLEDNPAMQVFIVGHTDWVGAVDYNISLSQRRAAAVVEHLVKEKGIRRERLEAHGVGPLSPRTTNANDQGRAQNRRVEMVAKSP